MIEIIDGIVFIDGVESTPEQAQAWAHQQSVAQATVADALLAATTTTRTALTDALNLAALYPAPTPEETALIDSQVASALAGFRALTDPPADVVALAAAVVSWRAEVV